MTASRSPEGIDGALFPAIVIAGGLGTRLRSLFPDRPKTLVPVRGRPFIDYVIESLIRQGAGTIAISTGYRGEEIESHFRCAGLLGSRVLCVREPEPLGTGGAIAYALAHLRLEGWFLAVNGDSLAAFEWGKMRAAVDDGADAAIVGVRVGNSRRFGMLTVRPDGSLAGFEEKGELVGGGMINAGIYLLNARLFPKDSSVPAASIEREYIPQWIRTGKRIAVIESGGPFVDIGTPESLAEAAQVLAEFDLFRNAKEEGS